MTDFDFRIAPTDADVFWGLVDGEMDTPVSISELSSTNAHNFSYFHRLPLPQRQPIPRISGPSPRPLLELKESAASRQSRSLASDFSL